jgi:hypothetical protein
MFSSTQDIFYLVASICLAVVSGFLCYALYWWATLGKNSNTVVEDVRDKIEKASSIVEFIKSKALSLGMKGLMMILDKAKEKGKKRKASDE